jgi:ribosome-associated translation inhibitor RaiA
MQIQVHAGRNLHGGESLLERVQQMVESSITQHADRITRIEVHLSDENSVKGGNDKRCVLEARLTGLDPIAVTHQAESVALAVEGAAEKLGRAIGHTLGRLKER